MKGKEWMNKFVFLKKICLLFPEETEITKRIENNPLKY